MNADRVACSRRLPDDQVDLVFRMLADATRVQVLWALEAGEMSVNDLRHPSTHLLCCPAPREATQARLVRTRREGTTIFYSLDNDHVRRQLIS